MLNQGFTGLSDLFTVWKMISSKQVLLNTAIFNCVKLSSLNLRRLPCMQLSRNIIGSVECLLLPCLLAELWPAYCNCQTEVLTFKILKLAFFFLFAVWMMLKEKANTASGTGGMGRTCGAPSTAQICFQNALPLKQLGKKQMTEREMRWTRQVLFSFENYPPSGHFFCVQRTFSWQQQILQWFEPDNMPSSCCSAVTFLTHVFSVAIRECINRQCAALGFCGRYLSYVFSRLGFFVVEQWVKENRGAGMLEMCIAFQNILVVDV